MVQPLYPFRCDKAVFFPSGTAKIVLSPWQIDTDPDTLCQEVVAATVGRKKREKKQVFSDAGKKL